MEEKPKPKPRVRRRNKRADRYESFYQKTMDKFRSGEKSPAFNPGGWREDAVNKAQVDYRNEQNKPMEKMEKIGMQQIPTSINDLKLESLDFGKAGMGKSDIIKNEMLASEMEGSSSGPIDIEKTLGLKLNFNQAFSIARTSNLKSFLWGGKEYGTELAKSQPAMIQGVEIETSQNPNNPRTRATSYDVSGYMNGREIRKLKKR